VRKRNSKIPFVLVGIFILIGLIFTTLFLRGNAETPMMLVERFYSFEQQGDFGSSWDLFHEEMKGKFSKNAYVTERSHIYMSHFGVTTYSFEIVAEENVKEWSMSKGGPTFTDVTKVTVELLFHSKFGVFMITQDVFVVEEGGKLKLLWEFKE